MNIPYKLKDWVEFDKLDWFGLSINTNAIHLLEMNPDKIIWEALSMNENAIHILEKNIDKIHWLNLCKNLNAIPLLEKNMDKIEWNILSANPNAIHLLEQNIDKINWLYLSYNPNAIHLLKKYPLKINMMMIGMNPNAYDIIIQNIDIVNKYMLSYNSNQDLLELLLKNYSSYIDDAIICGNSYAFDIFKSYYQRFPYKIYWESLCTNPKAIDMILENKQHIDWEMISYNPEIFEIDYLNMKSPIGEDLAKHCFHPSKMDKFSDWGYDM